MDSSKLFCLFCGYSVPNHYDTFREEEHYFWVRRPHVKAKGNLNDEIKIQ